MEKILSKGCLRSLLWAFRVNKSRLFQQQICSVIAGPEQPSLAVFKVSICHSIHIVRYLSLADPNIVYLLK